MRHKFFLSVPMAALHCQTTNMVQRVAAQWLTAVLTKTRPRVTYYARKGVKMKGTTLTIAP
jgi:hypothetical protein